MKRIFGKKKPETPGPTLDEVAGSMDKRASSLDAKINDIDSKLRKYKEQIASSKTTAAQRAAKQQALRLLKQKKMYENQRDQLYSQQINMESTAFMQQQLKDTADQVAVMKVAQKQIAQQMKIVNIDEVEDLTEQMQDLWYDHEEIQEVLGRSFAVQDNIDEDELLEELDLIEEELALEPNVSATAGVPAFLEEPDLPAAPTAAAEMQANPVSYPNGPLHS